MADLYRLFIKSEEGKTRVVMGHKDQHGFWINLDKDRYYAGSADSAPQAEKRGKDGKPVKWTLLDKTRTGEKVGR